MWDIWSGRNWRGRSPLASRNAWFSQILLDYFDGLRQYVVHKPYKKPNPQIQQIYPIFD